MSTETITLNYTLNGVPQSCNLNKDRLVIGRSPACDVVIREERVSRQHATIVREGNGWSIFDMGSANGTLLNDRPIVKSELRNGDVIMVGEIPITFDAKSLPEASPHRVVFDQQPARGNKTAVLNMADLSVVSEIGSRSAAPSDTGQAAAAWAIGLFSQAAETLMKSEGLDEVLENVMDLVFKNLPVDRGVLALYEESGEIVPRVTRGRLKDRRETICISQTIAEEAIRLRQAILVGDVLSDARFGQEDSILAMNIHSAMCAPLYNDGNVCGILYVDTVDFRKAFTKQQLHVLSTLAMFSAVAVDQTRLRDNVSREKRIRERLEKYNSPAVVEEIVRNAHTGTNEVQGGMLAQEREVTVIFADLCGFTTMSENLPPQEVAQVLNGVFESLTNAIFAYDGTLDKYMGDGMMAFFGAPLEQPDHAIRAMRAALLMKEDLNDFNQRYASDTPIRMRVGINSGQVIAGDIGSPMRKDYTVIGDTVNIASRFESSVAKPGQIVVGPNTYQAATDSFVFEMLDEVMLKGKRKPVRPYLLLAAKDAEPFPELPS